MAKLLTHHDPYHIHALLGLSALIHFLIRLVILPLMGWQYDGYHVFTLVHGALALTSFFFRIPFQRNGLYTIYREMQLHTIVFSLRSLFVYAWAAYGAPGGALARLVVVLSCHVMADIVTWKWATPTGGTTIRRFDGEKSAYETRPLRDRIGVLAMSVSQLAATWFLLAGPISAAPVAAFAVMLPVQGSALLATLVRKGKLDSYKAGIVYIGLIGIAFAHFPWAWTHVGYIAAACVMRFALRTNKYLMWIILAGLAGSVPMLPPLASFENLDIGSSLSGAWEYANPAGLQSSFQGMLDDTASLYTKGNAFVAKLLA